VGTFLPNLGTLGLCVLELFAMYATDRRTDRQTEEGDGRTNATLIAPFHTVGDDTKTAARQSANCSKKQINK